MSDPRTTTVKSNENGVYVEFRGRRYTGFQCPAIGQEVVVDYYTAYIDANGDERISSIAGYGPCSGEFTLTATLTAGE